jgi:aryl sulfotransferase
MTGRVLATHTGRTCTCTVVVGVRDLPNIPLVHFADLLEDPERQIRRVARHLDVPIKEGLLSGVLQRVSFKNMKETFDTTIFPQAVGLFRGGGQLFMNKGTNGH